MKCLNCNNEFEAKRKSARFCSSKCRQAFGRKPVSVTDNVTLKTHEDGTDKVTGKITFIKDKDGNYLNANERDFYDFKRLDVPLEERKGKAIEGYCHGCGKEVMKLICICLECVGKGVTHESLGLDINKCSNA